MLQYRAVDPATLELLIELSAMEILSDFALAGGTALALQLGHRVSVDLDFFTSTSFDEKKILDKLRNQYSSVQILTNSTNSLNIFIKNIRVDFLSHQYSLCKPLITADHISLFSIEDIAAMKLSAIASRGSKKDFIDMYFILENFSLNEVFLLMKKKYPDLNQLQVMMSLTYFEDAEMSFAPLMIKEVKWSEVKNVLAEKVRLFS